MSATVSGGKISVDPAPASGSRKVGARIQRVVAALVARPLFWVLFVCATFVLPLYKSFTRTIPKAPPPLSQLGDFELVDQIGRRMGTEELKGTVWCAGFTAMSESEHGDALTRAMAKIRFRTRNLSGAFHLVTITLDPERDTLEGRDAYAQRFHAAAPTWSFLGGDVPAVEQALARFQLSTAANPSMAEFSRRERLVLVDKQGKIRGYYTTDPDALDAIVADIGLLANDAP